MKQHIFCRFCRFFLPGGILLFAGAGVTLAQDPGFSQLYANPLFLNPAFAGTREMPRAGLFYRQQGPGIDLRYVSFGAAYDQPWDFVHGGIGVQAWTDLQGSGTIRRTSVDALYSYQMQATDELFIDAGFQASFIQKKVVTSGLVLPDMIDPGGGGLLPTQEGPLDYGKSFADFSVGFMAHYRDLFAGIAVHHLTEPNESFSESIKVPLYRKYSLQAGLALYAGGRRDFPSTWVITPHMLVLKQHRAWLVTWGVNVNRYNYVAGIRMRQDRLEGLDALIILAGLRLKSWDIAYSIDLELPRDGIVRPLTGGHELSLMWNFNLPEKRKRIRAIKCPRI